MTTETQPNTPAPPPPMGSAKERNAAYHALRAQGITGPALLTALAQAFVGDYDADLLKQARAIIASSYRDLPADTSAEDAEAAEGEALKKLSPAMHQAVRDAATMPPGPLAAETWGTEDPPERQWLIPGILPAGRLASIYGAGEAGKSSLMLQISAAVMHGGTPLPTHTDMATRDVVDLQADHALCQPMVPAGKVAWLSWEDETDEMRRRWRMAHAAGAISRRDPDPEQLSWIDMRKIGASLWGPIRGQHSSTVSSWTDTGKRFVDMLDGYALAVIDPLAAAYSGSEIDRSLVRAFASALDGAAEASGCTVMLIAHPSMTGGAQGGGGYSGSTDWKAAPRSMFHLETAKTGYKLDDGSKEGAPATSPVLRYGKANYGESGARMWLVRHFEPRGEDRYPQLAWYVADARTAAEAAERRAARIGRRQERAIVAIAQAGHAAPAAAAPPDDKNNPYFSD